MHGGRNGVAFGRRTRPSRSFKRELELEGGAEGERPSEERRGHKGGVTGKGLRAQR